MTSHRPIFSLRGSALVATVIFGAVLALLAASILTWVRTERRLDQRQFLRLEARNAAEALAEWGFYQVRAKVQNASAYTANMFQPSGGSHFTLPSTTFFQGGHVDTANLELFGGATPAQAAYFVDPNDPNNFGDPLKGKYIFRRNIPVYSKVTVSQPGAGPPISAYVSETISIRGAPLFAHAIFYNMDLELSPGPTMVISGPVHANGNIWASSGSSSLTFQSSVTCTGNIYHAYKWASTTTVGTGPAYAGTGMNTNNNAVYINNVAGTAVNMNGRLNGESTNTWDDSTLGGSTAVVGSTTTSQAAYQTALATAATGKQAAFRKLATSVWSGYVQTKAMGVQNYTPAAIGAYSAQTTTTSDDSVNSARTIIEPPTDPASAQYNADVETQKFSNQAAVYVKIVPPAALPTVTTTVSGTTTTTVTTYPAGTISVYTGGPPSTGHLVANPSIANLVTYKPYKETKTKVGSGTPTYAVNNGMYDQRNGEVASTSTAVGTAAGNTDIVELDMNGLRNVVAQMQLPIASQNTAIALDGLTTSNWKGIVYVEVAGGPTTNTIAVGGVTVGSTADATNARAANTALRIINGTGIVATYGTANPGLTLATNAPLYVKGNYNADGTVGATSATAVDSANEVPACLAADAITLLSSGYVDSTSKKSNGNLLASTSANVELATAMIIGNVPTDKNGNSDYSGGAHNLPRFLENWSGDGTYIRGSLVCLFESRVADAPLTTNYYNPPNRNWGFSDLFKSGSYPPGTPKVMSYRRLDYSDLTAVQYAAAKAANP